MSGGLIVKPEKHVFVCVNARESGHPKGSCANIGSNDIFSQLREGLYRRGLNSKFKVTKTGCLGPCAQGVSVVVYPDGVWYGKILEDDLDEFVETQLIQGRPLERLVISET